MPRVGKRHFSYDEKGTAEARKYAKAVGKSVKKTKIKVNKKRSAKEAAKGILASGAWAAKMQKLEDTQKRKTKKDKSNKVIGDYMRAQDKLPSSKEKGKEFKTDPTTGKKIRPVGKRHKKTKIKVSWPLRGAKLEEWFHKERKRRGGPTEYKKPKPYQRPRSPAEKRNPRRRDWTPEDHKEHEKWREEQWKKSPAHPDNRGLKWGDERSPVQRKYPHKKPEDWTPEERKKHDEWEKKRAPKQLEAKELREKREKLKGQPRKIEEQPRGGGPVIKIKGKQKKPFVPPGPLIKIKGKKEPEVDFDKYQKKQPKKESVLDSFRSPGHSDYKEKPKKEPAPKKGFKKAKKARKKLVWRKTGKNKYEAIGMAHYKPKGWHEAGSDPYEHYGRRR